MLKFYKYSIVTISFGQTATGSTKIFWVAIKRI